MISPAINSDESCHFLLQNVKLFWSKVSTTDHNNWINTVNNQSNVPSLPAK